MGAVKWKKWLSEGRAINRLYGDGFGSLLVGNFPSHGLNDKVSEVLNIINKAVYGLSPNAINWVQRADSIIIQKV